MVVKLSFTKIKNHVRDRENWTGYFIERKVNKILREIILSSHNIMRASARPMGGLGGGDDKLKR